MEKPLVHQMVMMATAGMNQGIVRQTLTLRPVSHSIGACSMPNCTFVSQSHST
ncbi:MAG: hypothetical protein RIT14_2177 [Pseudomonadota bacterium]